MRLTITIFIILLAGIGVHAQQNYDASLIPKELLPYASSVVRNEETTVEIKDLDNVVYHFKEAITILNKNGDDDAEIELAHNKSYIIKNIKGVVYNEFGKVVNKFSESDFQDVNVGEWFTLFDDTRVKYYRPTLPSYPYTVEYEYELRSKISVDLTDWEPNPGTGIAVEMASYTIICKSGFDLRLKEINMPSAVSISTDADKGLKKYEWKVSNLKAFKKEPYGPNPDKYLSIVKAAPVKFSFAGMPGSYTNWNQLGKWISENLLANRQTLPVEAINNIQQVTTGITDPKLKAKRIYEYMQNKTHYIDVVVGIGGVQPMLATDVEKLNYGDCKALVNYTQSLLKAVNIESYYCIVTGDRDRKIGMLNDFASMNQGNHIILCLPFKNDTTWCDCTSQSIPFGYLGDFTDDRNVLACTPTGGKLMHTPKYTAGENLQDRKATFVLNSNGELSGNMVTTFTGVEYETRDGIKDESKTDQVKIMQRIYPINNMDIEKLEFIQDKSLKPITTEKIQLKAPEYASADNGRINFNINAVNRLSHAPHQVTNRKTDVYINEGYTQQDEAAYTLPAGYRNDTSPLNVKIDKPFGSFSTTSEIKDGKLIYKRRLQVIDGTYPKDTYDDLVDFFQQVVDADAYTITLVKTAN